MNTLLFFAWKIAGIIILALLAVGLLIFFAKIVAEICSISPIKISIASKINGIVFGRYLFGLRLYSPSTTEGHVFVSGGSGSGKTSALLIPTLNSWKTGSSFVIDIAGDIIANVNMPHPMVYSPSTPTSLPFNIFSTIDRLASREAQDGALARLAILLMNIPDNISGAEAYFKNEGLKILTASFVAFYHAGLDFIAICERIAFSSCSDLFRAIDAEKNETASLFITSFVGVSPQNTAGCKQACDAAIKLFATDKSLKKTIRRPKESEIAFTTTSVLDHNVFFVLPEHLLKLYSPLLNITVGMIIDFLVTRPLSEKSPVLLALDEFSALGKLEIANGLHTLRKRNVRIMLLTQSPADIDIVYGYEERKSMIDNMPYKVILSASDPDSQEYFSRLIGNTTFNKTSVTSGYGYSSTTTSEAERRVVPPEEFARLKNKLILIHPGGFIKLNKNFFYSR